MHMIPQLSKHWDAARWVVWSAAVEGVSGEQPEPPLQQLLQITTIIFNLKCAKLSFISPAVSLVNLGIQAA